MDGQTQSMIPPFLAMLYFFGLKVDLQLVFFRINRGWRRHRAEADEHKRTVPNRKLINQTS